MNEIHEICGKVHTSLEAEWFCASVKSWYSTDRAPRRSSEEVVYERRRKREAIVARREFNAKKRAEKASTVRDDGDSQIVNHPDGTFQFAGTPSVDQ